MSGARQPEFSALLLQPFYESAPMSKQSQESWPRRKTITGGYLPATVPDFLSDYSTWPMKNWEPQLAYEELGAPDNPGSLSMQGLPKLASLQAQSTFQHGR